jgi:hypothetical protein
MKILKINHILVIIGLLLCSACEKEGKIALKPIKALKPYEIKGYVIGDTLEQYFDGLKIRDYYGKVSLGVVAPLMAFENDITVMQLKKKSTGQIVYEQKFQISNTQNIVPNFYFDGTNFKSQYNYPDPQGNEYIANFYLDAPKDAAAADINIDVLEYYFDLNNQLVVVNTTSIPVGSNIKPGVWTAYLQLQVPPILVPTQSGTEFYPIVTIRNSNTKAYYINNNRDDSTLQIEIPDQWTSTGKVQSIHLAKKIAVTKIIYLELNDLVQLFPR